MATDYDVLVIGGGLAGLTAAMYAARYGLSVGVIERMMGGASIINVEKIENYPGLPDGIMGADLAAAAQEQAMNAGAQFIMAEASAIAAQDGQRIAQTDAGQYRAQALIIAAGSTLRTLGIPGEDEFAGRGVSQCATCDGPLYAGETVGVAGGGDSAADEALVLTQYAQKVLLFHRRDTLRAQKALADQVLNHPKIEIIWNTVIDEVLGETAVTAVRATTLPPANHTANPTAGQQTEYQLSGLFVYIGLTPNSGSIAQGLLETDPAGHIPVNLSMETAIPGIYAIGDIRQHSSSQLISAAGDGATAAIAAHRYITANPRQ